MRSPQRFLFLLVLLSALPALPGCSATETVGSWADPQFRGRAPAGLLVVGDVQDASLRRQFEDQFAAALQERGTKAVASYRFFPASPPPAAGPPQAQLRDLGLDGVLAIRLLGQDKVATYRPDPRGYGPYRPYGPYAGHPLAHPYAGDWPYYGGGWPGYYGFAPAYTETVTYATAFVMETGLYQGEKGELVWSARTRTTTEEPLASKVEEVVEEVTKQMEEHGLI